MGGIPPDFGDIHAIFCYNPEIRQFCFFRYIPAPVIFHIIKTKRIYLTFIVYIQHRRTVSRNRHLIDVMRRCLKALIFLRRVFTRIVANNCSRYSAPHFRGIIFPRRAHRVRSRIGRNAFLPIYNHVVGARYRRPLRRQRHVARRHGEGGQLVAGIVIFRGGRFAVRRHRHRPALERIAGLRHRCDRYALSVRHNLVIDIRAAVGVIIQLIGIACVVNLDNRRAVRRNARLLKRFRRKASLRVRRRSRHRADRAAERLRISKRVSGIINILLVMLHRIGRFVAGIGHGIGLVLRKFRDIHHKPAVRKRDYRIRFILNRQGKAFHQIRRYRQQLIFTGSVVLIHLRLARFAAIGVLELHRHRARLQLLILRGKRRLCLDALDSRTFHTALPGVREGIALHVRHIGHNRRCAVGYQLIINDRFFRQVAIGVQLADHERNLMGYHCARIVGQQSDSLRQRVHGQQLPQHQKRHAYRSDSSLFHAHALLVVYFYLWLFAAANTRPGERIIGALRG